MSAWLWIKSWLGLNPQLPFTNEVANPTHGQEARNTRSQKVLYDEKQEKWVLPQNFSGKLPVTIK